MVKYLLKYAEGKSFPPRILYPMKLSLNNESKDFFREVKTKCFCKGNKPLLKQILNHTI